MTEILVTASARHIDPTLAANCEGVISPYTAESRRLAGDGIMAWILTDVLPGELAGLTADVKSVWQDAAVVTVLELSELSPPAGQATAAASVPPPPPPPAETAAQ